ncbi:polysaccharide deacetylase family protein [Clostridium sp.]|uniref:polysaccharide deacetylase family protein n=1 Tax=Clostridium sp. TaxID=1506 RepID=UPI001A3F593D|nr:polysaccharide deacetylase family protein [Clostridium sp.]MBK5243049.1 polysaccharide deacetylase family protein [Clostridium sp.]
MINTIDHIINIDLANKINMNKSIYIKKNDTDSHKFVINIFNSGINYDLTGTTAKIYFKKPDGTKVFLDCIIDSVLNNKISSLLTNQVLTSPGQVESEITIYGTSGEILTSVTFNFTVSEVIRDDMAIESTSEFTALTNALAIVTNIALKADKTYVDSQDLLISNKVGSLTSLNTSDKTNIVNSINENVEQLATNTQQIILKAEKTEVNAVDLRVDNLVIPISATNTNIEVTDAHNSIVKNKTFTSLKNRLEASETDVVNIDMKKANNLLVTQLNDNIKQIVDNVDGASVTISGETLKNKVSNSVYADGIGWVGAASTLTVNDNACTTTGNGTSAYVNINQNTKIVWSATKRLFIKAKVRVTNANCSALMIWDNGTTGGGNQSALFQTTPVQNQWYEISSIVANKGQTGELQLYLKHDYADSATALGKVMEAEDIVIVDLGSDTSNELYNKTAAEMNVKVPVYFKDTIDVVVGSVKYTGDKETTQYFPNIKLRSLPNGTRDYITNNQYIKNISDLVDADNYYQLSVPVVTDLFPVQATNIESIIYQNIYKDSGIYDTKLSLTTNILIKTIVSISRFNQVDRSKTFLDISQAVILSDKLSFTHPSLIKGDLIEVEYEFNSNITTIPTVDWSKNASINNDYEFVSKQQVFPQNNGAYSQEVMQGGKGVSLTSAKVNLFGTNTDFEKGIDGTKFTAIGTVDGWYFSQIGAIKTSYAEISSEQSYTGNKSVKMFSGSNADENGQFKKLLTLSTGSYSIGFAIYAPNIIPDEASFYIIIGSTYTASGAYVTPTDKEGWYWVSKPFVSDGSAKFYGVMANGKVNPTIYVDSFIITRTLGEVRQYVETKKGNDRLEKTVQIGKEFTVGMIVKANQIYNINQADVVFLGVITSTTGDKYTIEYRKLISKFAVKKTVGGVITEVLSNVVQYNPNAVFGIAIQQSRIDLKLFVAIPRGIVVDFDDGHADGFELAYPVMKQHGIKGTIHMIINNIGVDPYMSYSQLKELKQNGWTVDNHTMSHVNLGLATDEIQLSELTQSVAFLKAHGFDYDLIATPNGTYNNYTQKLFRDLGIRMNRQYTQYQSNVYPFKNRYNIYSDPVSHAELASETMARVDDRMNQYMLMHLTFHGISIVATDYNYDPTKFAEVMEHIAYMNYPTYSYAEVADAYFANKIIGNVEEFSIADTTPITGLNKLYLGSDENFLNHFEGVYKDLFVTNDILGRREIAELWDCKY